MSTLSKEQLIVIAEEMYSDGTFFSEHYSEYAWKQKGWPPVDDVRIYKILDSYIKFLRTTDEYHGKETPQGGAGGAVGTLPPRSWNKT